jgi:hypothetical protein
MAASVASATCCHGTRRPTGSARGAGGGPRGCSPTASTSSRRLTSWTGWPISCRHRVNTGTGITGWLPRITSSGPPSPPMTKGNVGKRRDAATDGHAVGGHAASGDATGHGCDSCDKPPSHDTSRRQRPDSWPARGRSFLLRARGVTATSGSEKTAGRSRLTSNRRFASGRRPGWLRPREVSP